MKHFILGFIIVFGASVAAAQAQTDWQKLVTGSGASGFEVEGATKIDVSTAKTLHDRGVTFIDSRSTRRWKQGHIPGASNLYVITEAALMEIVDKDKEVVFYCGGTDCSLSPNACARALTWGYEKVYYFAEGKPGWKAAGYPLEKSE
jgi:rhodanese-related sulfurtransferase